LLAVPPRAIRREYGKCKLRRLPAWEAQYSRELEQLPGVPDRWLLRKRHG